MGEQRTGLTLFGKLLSVLLIGGLIAAGAYLVMRQGVKTPGVGTDEARTAPRDEAAEQGRPPTDEAAAFAEPAETKTEVPRLDAPAPYTPKDDTIVVELSEYAGYSGLIAANGGLEPNDNSVFYKKHGFKVRLTLSEEESWSKLNRGEMAASATTVDVLAVYGKQFDIVVPALIGFSRGADGVVVRSDIKRINQLAGKVLATSQFTEAEFFIRYLAQEAGLEVAALPDLDARPNPQKVNLVFADDAFKAGDLFLQDLKENKNKLHGTITWAPKTTEVAEGSAGRAHVLTTNKNLLIVADILVVNKGFAQANPKMVAGLVDGLLEGNRMVRDDQARQLDVVSKAFGWTWDETKEELAKVHLANLPENLAFFSGAIDAAGSFGGIYASAAYAYGHDLIPDPPPAERFVDLSHLQAIEQAGTYKDQKVAIAPIKSQGGQAIEENPLLSKNIRFLFKSNSYELDLADASNIDNLAAIKELLQVSPGSTVLLRGHVDDAKKEEFRKEGDSVLRSQALRAMELSKNRANEIKRLLVERNGVDPKRVDAVGRGWDEPVNTEMPRTKEESIARSEANRRVEVQWFTLE
jgi:NitT/TauT family transport system substrate-binding protein